MKTYKVIDIHEKDYGCEEIPEGMSRLNPVVLEDAAGKKTTLDLTDFQLDEGGAIYEGDTVTMDDQHNLRKVK